MSGPFLFVGERRSKKAIAMAVTWEHGRLAARQLFDALISIGITPKEQKFANIFEPQGRMKVDCYRESLPIVGMGRKVQKELTRLGINHIAIVHPAARGTIRRKENYAKHIKDKLCTTPT